MIQHVRAAARKLALAVAAVAAIGAAALVSESAADAPGAQTVSVQADGVGTQGDTGCC